MTCIFCGPSKWVCAILNAGFADMQAEYCNRARSWEFEQVDDSAIWEREPHKDRFHQAFAIRETDPEAAFAELRALAQQGSVFGMIHPANAYSNGIGVTADRAVATEWYERAFEGGSQFAQLWYGRMLGWRGDLVGAEAVFAVGVAEDWAPALYWFPQYRLRRSDTDETLREVRPLLEIAAAKDSVPAHLFLASRTVQGYFGLRAVPKGIRLMNEGIKQQ